MSVTYKDIDDLSQKATIAGTEKIPVSDTEYITSGQIAASAAGTITDVTVGGTSVVSGGTAVIPAIPDVSGKADKVSNATNGDFASLDSSGNLTDSGKKTSDFLQYTLSGDVDPSITPAHYATREEVDLKIDGVGTVDKGLVWSNGYTNDYTGVITASGTSQFCQPVLLKAGEKISYKTSDYYLKAVVKVADGSPVAIGDTLSGPVIINYGTANTTVEYTATEDIYIVICVKKSSYEVTFTGYNEDSVAGKINNLRKISGYEDWQEINGELVADDKRVDYQGGLINYADWSVRRKLVRKGDIVRITQNADQYTAVWSRQVATSPTLEVLMTGAVENPPFEYVIPFDGYLVYSIQDGDDSAIILRSSVTEDALAANPLKGKRILCLGDSITEFTNSNNGMGYPDWIATKTGAIVTKGGIGGTQIAARATATSTPTSSSEAFAALDIVNIVEALCSGDWTKQTASAEWLRDNGGPDKTSIVATLSTLYVNDFDYITILGGTNDWYGATTKWGDDSPFSADSPYYVNSAINRICYLLSYHSPNTKLIAITPIVRYTTQINDAEWSDIIKERGLTLGDFSARYMDCFRKNHIPCCDLYWGLGWNKNNFPNFFISGDTVHPYKGFEQIADKIISFLSSVGATTDNGIGDLLAAKEAIFAVLGMTQGFTTPATTLVEDGKAVNAYGNVSELSGYQIRSITVQKGDLLRMNAAFSQYVAVYSSYDGSNYSVLKVGDGYTMNYYIVQTSGTLYYNRNLAYDDISLVHSDLLASLV